MIGKHFLPRTGIGKLRQALDAYSLRQRVTAENIANVQTPGYSSKKVLFEENLKDACSRRLRMTPVPVPPRGFPVAPTAMTPLRVENEGSGYFNGVNDVNMETEMIDIARTNMAYNMVARMTKGTIDKLRSAIAGKVG